MNYDDIGNFIQQKRKSKNLTQKELAQKIGVTDRAISKWERGQGCPDVSILEILSKELDCSILELLKGRKIENEVIPVTEADDYIRDSLLLSKNKVKNVFIKITELSIIFMVALLGYLNVVQMLYIDKEYDLDFRNYRRAFSKAEKNIDDNLKLINNNQGKFLDDDYAVIKEKLNLIYQNIKDVKVYQYIMSGSEIKYSIHDRLYLEATPYIIDKTDKIIKILEKYNNGPLVSDFYQISLNNIGGSRNVDAFLTYRYRLTLNEDYGEYLYGSDNIWISQVTNVISRYMSELDYLTELVKKVGEINE